jgi:hypothetical protein
VFTLIDRFLKRVQTTAGWEEVSDDTAREKASQVLRDAVAGLLEKARDAPPNEEPIPLPAVSASLSSEQESRDVARAPRRSSIPKPVDYYRLSGDSSMVHSHQPQTYQYQLSESAKRRRYSQECRNQPAYQSFDDSSRYPVPPSVASTSSLTPGYSPIIRRHSDDYYMQHVAHSDPTGRRPPTYQHHYQYHHEGAIDPRQSRASLPIERSSRESRQQQHQQAPPSVNLDEFELFQGELLDSDVE